MLTYRGDKFVKGKKFKINENDYRFSKRNDDKLIFEAVKDSSTLVMTEEEYNKAEQMLTEKINQENKEINEIIGKVLRSKGLARKYEDLLKSKGITIDYDQGQGVSLKGTNGKWLSASSKEVHGPSKPGRNDTHYKGWSDRYKRYSKEAEEELNALKSLDRDDIIRKYPKLSTEEALKKHEDEITSAEENYKYYKDLEAEENQTSKKRRREGHLNYSHNYTNKEQADKVVDYLTYLTKPDTGEDFRSGKSYRLNGNRWSGYSTKNPVDNSKSETLTKYKNLKHEVDYAKNGVESSTYNDNNKYNWSDAAMTDEQLEAKIQKMRDDLEAQIEKLRADNVTYNARRDDKVQELKNKEKELADFLKEKKKGKNKN